MRLLLHLVCTLLLLSCANCIDDPGVVIIGAGAAGIAAASRLYKNGFKNLTILEAEDRIGGRVYSLKLGDAYIDLGAQWCHGEKDNVVYELVKDLNVLNDDFFVPLFYHSKRKLIDTEFAVKMTEIFETTYGNVSTDQKGPLGEYLTTRYNEATRDAWKDDEDKLALAADCLHSFRIWVEGYEAAFSWFDVAASSIYEVCEGNSALGWNGLGYKTILDVLMEKSAKSITDKVLLNHVVKQVVRSDSKVEVKCTNGASFTSDHVIWTPSLGVLKRGYKTLFTPQLSGEKVQAIQTLGMNAVLKVGLYFPTKWWNDDFRGVVFSWAASDLQKSGEAFPYGPKTGNKSWITTIICVTSVPKSPNLLLAWLAGALVPEIEKTSDETITDGVIYTLREFMGEDYPNITRPDRVIRKNWYIDPHFHGTYSFETVESRKLGRPQAEVLGEPILSDEGKPILLFAGEATNPRHHSTVHGAIESGFREADRFGADIVLNKSVSEISLESGKVRVSCTDLSSYTADHVIWTPSLGVLKHLHANGKIRAIQTLGIEAVSKIFFHFPARWWETVFESVAFVWTQADLQTASLEYTDEPKIGNRSWITTIHCIHPLQRNPNVLSVWFLGPLVPEIERLSDESIIKGVMHVLRKFLSEDYPTISRPDRIIRKKWYSDPNFGGSYSFETVESRKLGRSQAAVLAEPISASDGRPVILFAGEATSTNHYSTFASVDQFCNVHFNLHPMRSILAVLIALLSSVECRKEPSIVIIGAGAAGIAAASTLSRHGYKNVTILEAEGRIGGRIYSVHFGKSLVDLGAQWCHGEKNNVVYEMVRDLKLLKDDDILPELYHSTLKRVDSKFNARLNSLFEDIYLDENYGAEGSLGDFLAKRYKAEIRKIWKSGDKLALAEECLDLFERYVESEDGSFSWSTVAASGDFETCEGNLALGWNGLGYKTILDVLMRQASGPIECNIALNKSVTGISLESDKVRVSCSDLSSYTADHVIWTPSLGVLKHLHANVFKPNLPKEKVRAIETLGIDAVSKILLHFPAKWWDAEFEGVTFVWTPADLQSSSLKYPEGPKIGNRSWITTIYCIIPLQKNPNVLSVWFIGKLVPEIEQLSDETIINGVMHVMRQFLSEDYPNISRPDQLIRKNWYSDPNFRGTYSFETVESRKLGRSQAAILAEPIKVADGSPVILFAGEATSTVHYSTVHGAIETGFREANRIIELYK
ncbi:hypothetical protein PPYR_03087 [Photinus pyralis]|uniref:Amine oxidase domain-containing protein n=1 Tax=Photinus pyralis TaxID=7054 RepID=A0A5N4A1U1_PHOPY|nr:hypothetical protein PPYR_03087 [Photinus pyralis]